MPGTSLTVPPAQVAGQRRMGPGTVRFLLPPRILAGFTVAGPMECKGPMGGYMDTCLEDTFYGERCWERTESKMLKEAVQQAVQRAGLTDQEIDLALTTDLLNQNVSGNFAMRSIPIPHVGVYSACAGFAGGIALAAAMVDAGFAQRAVVGASSHHDAAERQYRFPTELGVQRPPTAQWTVTGAGAVVLAATGPDDSLLVTHATFGKILDMGLKDPYDMGSAMVPAAEDTLLRHLQDTGRRLEDFDWILTGDLGQVGSRILLDWLKDRHGLDIDGRHSDCGVLMYNPAHQDVHAGGSGLGATACVVSGYLLKAMAKGLVNRVLVIGTGSLHSPTTHLQGESIPVTAHAVTIERPGVS
ncbi:stage V sporulation protein AD [Carboxydochorda subterranea]|uniref:Stage V sporulation protein AD n=1 Tax=Carboxydichorda subterranea TaxID=3109565 RepID=A0ABZ1C0V6_9FIRM|nr:stage V sporulation protein AD [Limnochorda sp. L945t]WRP18574.1 stage V sporulation protein AD [Limnochorda sp. L945t]